MMNEMQSVAFRLRDLAAMQHVLPTLAKATIVALIGLALLRLLARGSAATRYLVVVATLTSMLLVPLVELAGPQWRVAILPAQPASVKSTAGAEKQLRAPAPFAQAGEATRVFRPIAGAMPKPIAESISIWNDVRATWREWLLLIALAVAAGMLARMVCGIAVIALLSHRAEAAPEELTALFEQLCRDMGLSTTARLRVSARVTVPMVWGIRRPALLLPLEALDWDSTRLRVVFLHELAHVQRGDGITLLLTRAATALFWFHPLALTLDRTARLECEQACDDLVLASGTRASEYADHLLAIAQMLPAHDPYGLVTVAMSRRSQLEGRLLSILDARTARGRITFRVALAALAVSAAIVLPIATVRLVAAPAPETAATRDDPGADWRKVRDDARSTTRAAVRRMTRLNSASDFAYAVKRTASDMANVLVNDVEPRGVGERAFERGMDALRDESYDEAVAEFQKAIDARYKVGTSSYNIACAYARQERKDEAFAWLDRAAAAGFSRPELLAEDDDLDALRSDPRFDPLVRRYAGDAISEKSAGVKREVEALRSAASNDPEAWSRKGRELLELRQLDAAITTLREAVRLDPFASSAEYNLACAYALHGDRDAALETLRNSVEHGYSMDKDDGDLRSLHGDRRFDEIVSLSRDLELSIGKFGLFSDTARYERVARAHPELGRAWFNLGFVQLRENQDRGAVDSFDRAVRANYRPGTSMYNLACAYAHLDDRVNAIHWLRKSADTGFDVGSHADGDDDLDNVRDDPWLTKVIAERDSWKHEKTKSALKRKAE